MSSVQQGAGTGGAILDGLKKKMRQTKEEMEKYKDECEEFHKRLQIEVMRREQVSYTNTSHHTMTNRPIFIWSQLHFGRLYLHEVNLVLSLGLTVH